MQARCQVEMPNTYGKKRTPVCGRRALASGYCRLHDPDMIELKVERKAAKEGKHAKP